MKQYKPGARRRALMVTACALAVSSFLPATLAYSQKSKTSQDANVSTPEKQSPAAAAKADGTWSVKATRRTPRTFTVKAKNAKLTDVTTEIARTLNVPVMLSPLMEKQRVTVDFTGLNLEATVRMLAPQSYIDYEVGGEDQYQPKALAIYLNALNERPPAASATVRGNSEAILIEGDTEEGVGSEEAQRKREEANPLKVSFVKNQISVRARRQPLSVVLYKIASEMGIPFEMRYDSPEIIDVDFSNYSIEQALRSLSPTVRLFYRSDLQNFEIQPLRIVLVAPASVKS